MSRFLLMILTLFLTLPGPLVAQSIAPPGISVSNQVHRRVGTPIVDRVEAKRHTVEIFVTSWCPYCRALESFLATRQISFTRYDVEHDAKGITLYQELGGGGVPITRIDGDKILRGFSIEALEEALGLGANNPQAEVRTIDVKRSLDLIERE